MNKIIFAIGIICSLSLLSCKEDEFNLFEKEANGKSGIYIQRNASWTGATTINYADSSNLVSFIGAKDTVKFIYVPVTVKVLGSVATNDRKFLIRSVPDRCINAVENEDFEIDENKCFVPAGQGTVNMELKVLRSPKFKVAPATIVLEIMENENFYIPFLTYRSTNDMNDINAKELSAVYYRIFVTEAFTEPEGWKKAEAHLYMGDWTQTKFNEINDVFGWTSNNWNNANMIGSQITMARMPYAAKLFRDHLQALADKGTPLKDEDGSYMQLVEPYLVDYSGVK